MLKLLQSGERLTVGLTCVAGREPLRCICRWYRFGFFGLPAERIPDGLLAERSPVGAMAKRIPLVSWQGVFSAASSSTRAISAGLSCSTTSARSDSVCSSVVVTISVFVVSPVASTSGYSTMAQRVHLSYHKKLFIGHWFLKNSFVHSSGFFNDGNFPH